LQEYLLLNNQWPQCKATAWTCRDCPRCKARYSHP